MFPWFPFVFLGVFAETLSKGCLVSLGRKLCLAAGGLELNKCHVLEAASILALLSLLSLRAITIYLTTYLDCALNLA